MKNLLLTLFMPIAVLSGLLPQSVGAQTLMPLPPHSNVYPGNVRGYWFTAPVNFTITGLRVEAQAGTGVQAIHVFKINDPTPVAYPTSSTNFTTLAYISNAPNNVIQTVNIPVTAGDKIGILGAVANGSSMANSYGGSSAATNATTIGSSPVTLYRLLYQGSINTAAAPNYSTEPASWNISRVEMWYSVGPPCNNVPAGLAASGITMTGATFNWNAVTGSQGYEYAVTTTASAPASGTAITANSYIATGLTVGTNYWFHVRNKCSTNSYSVWVSTPFSTLPCPTAGAPTIVTNVPGTVTISWPGSTNPGIVNYQYAITGSTAVPTSWQTTTTTTVTVPGLTPGNTYYAHVRSNCGSNTATDQYIQFVNPFPPCYAPASIMISGVNMHGAYIKWNRSTTVPAAQGYQYAVNTNPNPPATGTPTTDTFVTPTTLIGGVQYYVHIRTHCGTTNFSPWITDSFVTPATCLPTPTPNISNITPYTADISWQEYPGIYGYEYIIDNNPTAPTIGGAAISFNSLAPANLFSGTTYYFHLRVRCDAANYSPYSTTAFTTPAVCTTPPGNLKMTTMTPSTATFSWSPVTGTQQYQYSVTTTPTPVAGNNYVTQPTVKVLMLTPNTPYWFHVRANCSASDTSGWETIPFSTSQVAVGSVAGSGDFDLKVYPNPVRDVLQVEISGTIKGKATLSLFDLSGKLVRETGLDGQKAEIRMGDLARGTYILKYHDEEGSGTMRVQKL